MPVWNERQYLMFADERTRPSVELLSRVHLDAPRTVVDLGCGPGNSTRLLVDRWPGAEVIGVDNSPQMLARARTDLPAVEFVEADLATYRPPTSPDVLFANAVLQWLPDHEVLLPSLVGRLAPGGALAVQMPRNFDEPTHRLMRELPGPWADALASVPARTYIWEPEQYYDVLVSAGCAVDVWMTIYQHVMPDAAAIVEWVKGTGLRPYLDAVPAELRSDFLAAYTAAVDEAFPVRADGQRLFRFPRLFMVAQR